MLQYELLSLQFEFHNAIDETAYFAGTNILGFLTCSIFFDQVSFFNQDVRQENTQQRSK